PRRHPEPLPVVRALAGAAPRGGAPVAVALAHGRGGADLSRLRRAGLADPRLGPAGGVRAARARRRVGGAVAGAEPAWRRLAGGVAMSPEQSGRGRLAEMPWRTLTTRVAYRNPWIRIDEDQVEMPDGRTTLYGVVRCGECVGILPFLDPETVVLIRQYRYVARGVYWEMPTGGVHAGEAIEAAAQRELAEEVGMMAGRLVPLVSYHTSKSVVDETAHLFWAEDLTPAATPPDDTEFIEVR